MAMNIYVIGLVAIIFSFFTCQSFISGGRYFSIECNFDFHHIFLVVACEKGMVQWYIAERTRTRNQVTQNARTTVRSTIEGFDTFDT